MILYRVPLVGALQRQYKILKIKKLRISSKLFSDPAGIRTQDPYIKSVLLYRLSYRIGNIFVLLTTIPFLRGRKKLRISSKLSSDPAGIRTQDPYIKSVLLYRLSYRIGNIFVLLFALKLL